MKIAFAASAGGHLTQIQTIFTKDVIGNSEYITLTEKNSKTKNLPGQNYFFKPLAYNPIDYLLAVIKCIHIFREEKVGLVVTTGAEIGIPAVVAGRFLGIKTVFIDTVIRVKTPTLTGKICYPFSDIFLVQNKGMERCYGRRARYAGGII